MKKIFIISFLCVFLAGYQHAEAQAKIRKNNLSKGEKSALKDFENRQKGKTVDMNKKDDSFFAKIKAKRAAKVRKFTLKKAFKIQDSSTRKRMRKHHRASKQRKWKHGGGK